jgi:hypothetical protein
VIVSDPSERRAITTWIVANAWPGMDAESMAAASPMVEVTLDRDAFA